MTAKRSAQDGAAGSAPVRRPVLAVVEAWLGRDREQAGAWRRGGVQGVRLLFAVGRDVAAGQLTLRAMSLVYTTLLSLVPLLAISFSILKGFGVHNQIEPFLLTTLEPLGERSEEIVRQIVEFVDNIQVGVLGFVGFVFLFYTVVTLMQKIELAFNEVWQISRERSIAERFRDYLSVILLGPVLVFVSLGITATLLGTQFMQNVAAVAPLGWLIELAGRLVPVLMVIFAFTFIYMYVPNTRVRFAPAFVGGVVAGGLWHLLGIAFAAFVASATRYTAIYSGFATPILFMIWLYVGWLILLIGGTIAFYRQHPEYLGGRRVVERLSFSERERVGLNTLAMIGERYYGERPPASAEEVALRLAVPADVVEYLLKVLGRAHIVAPTDDEPPRYIPARPWEHTTLFDAIEAIRSTPHDDMTLALRGESKAVRQTLEALTDATRNAFGGITLKTFATQDGAARAD
jgi:membrane protein